MVSIYGYQNRPARKFSLIVGENKCKKTIYPTKKTTCSNSGSISLAGQFLRYLDEMKAPISLSAGGGLLFTEEVGVYGALRTHSKGCYAETI
jgi:hypothetical protein